jgi:hypothetical protein
MFAAEGSLLLVLPNLALLYPVHLRLGSTLEGTQVANVRGSSSQRGDKVRQTHLMPASADAEPKKSGDLSTCSAE